MRRRDFLRAGAIGAGALASPGALAAPSGVEAMLRSLERRKEQVGARLAPFREVLVELGIPGIDADLFDAVLPGLFATLTYAEFAELRPRNQRHPLAQKAIFAAAEDIAGAVRRLADVVEGLGDGHWERLEGALRADEASLDAALDRAMVEVEDLRVPRRAVDMLRSTFGELRLRSRREGLRGILDPLAADVRRMERSISEADDPYDPVRAVTPAAAADELDEPSDPDVYDDVPPDNTNMTRALGLMLLGVGIVGVIAVAVSVFATSGFVLICPCVSVPLLAGIIIVIISGALLASAK